MICVEILGSGQLAAVTRECAAKFHEVVTSDPDILWVCEDTPVAADDTPDADYVLDLVAKRIAEGLRDRVMILVSSQVPVGTCARLEALCPGRRVAVSPENIRRAHGVKDFMTQKRIVVGARCYERLLDDLLGVFSHRLVWMSPESAELVKHALNGYLAMCIAYANDLADVVEAHGGHVGDVFRGFRTDCRVAENAPLTPGGPYTGGTLGRDIRVLCGLTDSPLVHGIQASNTRRF